VLSLVDLHEPVQEEIIPFFQQVRFSKSADTALKCMMELAEQVKTSLKDLDPYFEKLAEGMVAWCECWKQLNPECV
jgi:reversibly glycosylated polypeptide / UDP-arabinopyranose mutase